MEGSEMLIKKAFNLALFPLDSRSQRRLTCLPLIRLAAPRSAAS